MDWTNLIVVAIITLVTTVVGGLIIEYIKNLKPKIVYNVREAVPIKIDGKKIGAYVISAQNPSSKTIKDVSINVRAEGAKLKGGGINSTPGLKFLETNGGSTYEIQIPFLKKDDTISATIYADSEVYVPSKPDITIRSPQIFALINSNNLKTREPYYYYSKAGIFAALIAAFTPIFFNFIDVPTQKDVLIFSANSAGLYDLAQTYAPLEDLKYYNQGDLVYAKAVSEKDIKKIQKYKLFLASVLDYQGIWMAKKSKCVLLYNLGKISLLLNENESAKTFFRDALKKDKRLVLKRTNYDPGIKDFLTKGSLI